MGVAVGAYRMPPNEVPRTLRSFIYPPAEAHSPNVRSWTERFHRYHRVLSCASWSSREVSRVLLGLLVEMFVPEGDPSVVGIDETLERRHGKKIAAKGV
jgi:hypothetical protein